MIRVIRYSPAIKQDWENLLLDSINGTFLHSRNFMEYHRERFEDFSLVFYKEGLAMGLFPAHKVGTGVCSHRGLTYGGIILRHGLSGDEVEDLLGALLAYLKQVGIRQMQISQVPDIYVRSSQEKLADLIHEIEPLQKTLTFNYVLPLPLPKEEKERNSRWRRIRNKSGKITVKEEYVFRDFWEKVLVPNLQERHQASPVHSLLEIELLARHNPGKIVQYNAYLEEELLAGTTLFIHEKAVNAQYTGSTEKGRRLRALDHLYFHLFELFADKSFFSLGTAHDADTFQNKTGLVHWKKSFGARAYVNEHFEVGL